MLSLFKIVVLLYSLSPCWQCECFERWWQDELENVEYGSDADKTQLSLDVLRRLKQRSHDLHQEVQTCCAYKVPHSSQLLSCAQGTVVVVSEQNSASHLTQSYLEWPASTVHYHHHLIRSQSVRQQAATHDSGTYTSNQCWLAGQVHLVTTTCVWTTCPETLIKVECQEVWYTTCWLTVGLWYE